MKDHKKNEELSRPKDMKDQRKKRNWMISKDGQQLKGSAAESKQKASKSTEKSAIIK